MSYSTAYGLLPGAVDTNNSVLLMNPAKNFTMSFNQLDTYFGFQHGAFNFIAGYQYSDVADYDPPPAGYQLTSSFNLSEAYMTYAITPQIGFKAGYFIPDFGSYNSLSPMLQLPNMLNQAIIEGGNGPAANGVEVAGAENNFSGSVSIMQQEPAVTSNVPGHDGHTTDAIMVKAGYTKPLKNGSVGVGASYANKGVQIDIIDPSSSWNPVWTANVHYSNPKLKVVGTVYHAELLPKDLWIFSGKIDYAVKPRIIVGAYADYMNTADTVAKMNQIQSIMMIHWIAGLHGQYKLTHRINLDAYLQYMRFVKAFPLRTKNISAVGAVSIKL